MSNSLNRHLVCVSLGYSIARLDSYEGSKGIPARNINLHICTPSCTEEHSFTPAESVQIYGLDVITALRDLLSRGIEIANMNVSEEPVVVAADDVNRNALKGGAA